MSPSFLEHLNCDLVYVRHVDGGGKPRGLFIPEGAQDTIQRTFHGETVEQRIQRRWHLLLFPAGDEDLAAIFFQQIAQIFALRLSMIDEQALIDAHSPAETTCQDEAVQSGDTDIFFF
jgi:hypothetical protein